MAHICFVVFYDDAALGLVTMANALLEAGHRVSNVHFKLPCAKPIASHKPAPQNVEFINSAGILHGTSLDVDSWTDHEVEKLLALLTELDPDLIGISSRSNYNRAVIPLCSRVRATCRKPMIAGGFGPTYDPAAYLEVCDWVCVGEGEECILQVAESLGHGKSPENSANLAFKRGEKIVCNPLSPAIDLQGTFRADDRIATWVIDGGRVYRARCLSIRDSEFYTLAGRGCAKGCVYCTAGQWYRVYANAGIPMPVRRNRPVDDIIRDLRGEP